jgi:hypothetical protein
MGGWPETQGVTLGWDGFAPSVQKLCQQHLRDRPGDPASLTTEDAWCATGCRIPMLAEPYPHFLQILSKTEPRPYFSVTLALRPIWEANPISPAQSF